MRNLLKGYKEDTMGPCGLLSNQVMVFRRLQFRAKNCVSYIFFNIQFKRLKRLYMFDSCQFTVSFMYFAFRLTRSASFIVAVHPLQCFFFSAWLIFYPHVIISTPSTCAHTAALFCRIRYKLHVGISTVHGV